MDGKHPTEKKKSAKKKTDKQKPQQQREKKGRYGDWKTVQLSKKDPSGEKMASDFFQNAEKRESQSEIRKEVREHPKGD